MTTEYLVVLRVLVDDAERPWWEALRLPDPATWSLSDTFGGAVFPRIVTEVVIDRGVRVL